MTVDSSASIFGKVAATMPEFPKQESEMDIRTIDLIIGAVSSLPFAAMAGYVLWLEYTRRQKRAKVE